MKLLFDQNISYKLTKKLLDLYPDSSHIGLHNLEKSDDYKVRDFAIENDYVIITQDSDFYDIALLKGVPPKIIWIRSGNKSTNYMENLIRSNSIAIKQFNSNKSSVCLEIF